MCLLTEPILKTCLIGINKFEKTLVLLTIPVHEKDYKYRFFLVLLL